MTRLVWRSRAKRALWVAGFLTRQAVWSAFCMALFAGFLHLVWWVNTLFGRQWVY